MLASLTQNWWKFLVRGIAAVLFGVLALVFPKPALVALVYLFGAYAIVDGICVTAAGITLSSYFKYWWVALLQGIAGILIGIATFLTPNITWMVLLYMVAVWAILTGILELVVGIRISKVIEGEWSMILGGVLSILLGVMLAVFPTAGSVGLVWAVAVYALIDGVRNIVFAVRVKGLNNKFETVGV